MPPLQSKLKITLDPSEIPYKPIDEKILVRHCRSLDLMKESINDSMRFSLRNFMWFLMRKSAWNSLWNTLWVSMENSMNDSVQKFMWNPMWDSLWGPMWDLVWHSMRDSMLSSMIHDLTKDEFAKLFIRNKIPENVSYEKIIKLSKEYQWWNKRGLFPHRNIIRNEYLVYSYNLEKVVWKGNILEGEK